MDLGLVHRVEILRLRVELGRGHRGHPHPQDMGAPCVGLVDEGTDPTAVCGVPGRCAEPGDRAAVDEALGVVRPHHDDHQLRLLVGQVDPELGRPVEVVGAREPGVDPGVEGGHCLAGRAQGVDEGLAQIETDRVTHHEDAQRVRRTRPQVEHGQRGGDRAGGRGDHRPGGARRSAAGIGRRERGPPAGRPAEDLVGPAHHVGEAERAAQGGNRADHVQRHRPAGAHRRDRGRALEARGVEEEPEPEAHHPDEEHPGPGDPRELPQPTRRALASGGASAPARPDRPGRFCRCPQTGVAFVPVVGDAGVRGLRRGRTWHDQNR